MSGRGAPDDADLPPRTSLQLLLDASFGPFFAAKVLATAGLWIYNIVAAILAYEISNSALVVGLVSVVQFGPILLLAPWSGASADRRDRQRQLALGKAVLAVGPGGLAVWLGIVGVDGLPGVWPVLLAALVAGIGFVLAAPAQNALLPSLVRRSELPTAVVLNSLPPSLARAAGPAIGAIVAVSVGPAVAFAVAALTNLIFAVVLLRLNVQGRVIRDGQVDMRVRAGLYYLGVDRAIVLLLFAVVAVSAGADPVITLTPALARQFGQGAELVGVFASSFGLGAGISFTVLTPLRHRFGSERVATTGLLLMSIGIAAVGVSPTATLAVLAFGVAGSGMTCALTSLATLLQQRLPDELRGRVMALWSMAHLGSRPLAAAFNGFVTDTISARMALLAVATLLLVAAWFARSEALSRRPPPNLHNGEV